MRYRAPGHVKGPQALLHRGKSPIPLFVVVLRVIVVVLYPVLVILSSFTSHFASLCSFLCVSL